MSTNLLTVRDVAQVLQCSEDKVIRLFARVDGVIDLGRPENINRRLLSRPTNPQGDCRTIPHA